MLRHVKGARLVRYFELLKWSADTNHNWIIHIQNGNTTMCRTIIEVQTEGKCELGETSSEVDRSVVKSVAETFQNI